MKTHSATPSFTATKESLLSCAVAGMLSLVGCSEESGPRVISSVEDRTMTTSTFTARCTQDGGLVQTHAVCGGVNACRGYSFNKYDFVLTEHTCKAMNTCGGISCVVLPEDSGLDAEEMFDVSCAGCHAERDEAGELVGFYLYVPTTEPPVDEDEAIADFLDLPQAHVVTSLAFGTDGRNVGGSSYSNMAPYHELYSVAELQRLTDYIRTLPMIVTEYGVLGENEELDPNAE